jgi:hypothetical protein
LKFFGHWSRFNGMRTIRLPADGEPVLILVMKDGEPIAQHWLQAIGPHGSIAHLQGGPHKPLTGPIGHQAGSFDGSQVFHDE